LAVVRTVRDFARKAENRRETPVHHPEVRKVTVLAFKFEPMPV
jgi:hypothetical protein